ncbi:MAG: hypothetical protein MZV64_10405 [Ignavibacteriales bacterium]|nr:hypothetical protein [Ignavibacteriales bacterium]
MPFWTKAKAKNETYKAQMTELGMAGAAIGELLPVERRGRRLGRADSNGARALAVVAGACGTGRAAAVERATRRRAGDPGRHPYRAR